MPRKAGSVSASMVANGQGPVKKPRLDSHASDDDATDASHPTSTAPKIEGVSNETLLQAIQSKATSTRGFRSFDFGSIQIPGHSAEELRAQYGRLRTAAFKNVRHLSLKKEVEFVLDYAHGAMLSSTDKPRKPKRPVSAFMRFLNHQRSKYVAKHPGQKIPITELAANAGEKWKALSDEKKKPFLDSYLTDLAKYYLENPELKKSTTKKKKGGTAAAKRLAAKSAFELFSDAKSQEYAEKYQLKGPELKQKLAAKFQKLSDRKREKWETRAREAMNEYLQAIMNQEGSRTAVNEAPPDQIVDDPILAKSPIDKKERKRTASSGDAVYNNYLGLLSADDQITSPRAPKPPKGSPKKSKASFESNDWLD